MCSSILGPIITLMDKYQGGDLTDIFRASTTTTTTTSTPSTSTCNSTTSVGVGVGVGVTSPSSSPLFSNYNHHHSHIINNNNNSSSSSSNPPNPNLLMNNNNNNQFCNSFGDPFSTMRDPFLHHLNFPSPPPPAYFAAAEDPLASAHQQLHLDDDVVPIIRPPSNNNNNIFSNIIQISPRPKLPPPPPPLDSSPATGITTNNNNMAPSSAASIDNAGLQISSPRNPTLKRRKSQAKKVVCIPAPAAANSRPSSGEVVPSDLWAWRKYGQKPIKGSPYPRGYYRCSSSKGCSARKQVERSRTDPNMLVITYTSEHNHPWPTQRNALAGSTRSQPSKNSNTNNASSIKTINNHPADQALIQPQSKPKEEEDHQADHMRVKEETEDDSSDHHKHIDQVEQLDELENNNLMEDNDDNTSTYTSYNHHHHRQFSDTGLAYKPSMLECNIQSDQDFFADLGEIEADPLNLLFTPPGFNNTDHHHHQHTQSKAALDPFHLFDWSAPDHSTSSFEDEPKRGL